ncbi:MAG: pantetheine-phosphate adenylyltransferase [Clostridia bacterium]|nr:pantetheine-phosphate adenylyltransferase [Clostridia bacterium]MBQ9506221.1 pantetheine-phosphate adenylyltransferase [Clostridia bacterium]MBR5423709.1 pantetheine-phosphate adenylyltransferase [Clostridia bacterium]
MASVAVCPGSFDPITIGHLNIISRAAKLFDRVIVVVMVNSRKKGMFTPDERMDFIRRSITGLDNVEVDYYDGLLADYAQRKGAVAIVKGLRVLSDYEDEFKQALTNKRLAKDIETIFLVTDTEYMFLSSSVVKEVGSLGGEIDDFVPPEIKDDIIKRIRER